MVLGGFVGWIRRKRRRAVESKNLCRSTAISLTRRTRTTLTGKEEWHKRRNTRDKDEFNTNKSPRGMKKRRGEDMEKKSTKQYSFGDVSALHKKLRTCQETKRVRN